MSKYLMKVIVISDDLRNSDYIKEPDWLVVDPNKVNEIRLFNKSYIQPVKCKDCKHRILNEHYGEKGYMSLKAECDLDTGDPFSLGRCAGEDDWFCADGERKDEVSND